jgi:hypothetical protein
VVLVSSNGIPRAPLYSGVSLPNFAFCLREFHPLCCNLPITSTMHCFNFVANPKPRINSVWAFPFSLAATQGIIIYFLFLWLLRCFSSSGSLLNFEMTLCVGFPHSEIFGSQRFTARQSLSQLYTSFIASKFQGIHHVLFRSLFNLRILSRFLYPIIDIYLFNCIIISSFQRIAFEDNPSKLNTTCHFFFP